LNTWVPSISTQSGSSIDLSIELWYTFTPDTHGTTRGGVKVKSTQIGDTVMVHADPILKIVFKNSHYARQFHNLIQLQPEKLTTFIAQCQKQIKKMEEI